MANLKSLINNTLYKLNSTYKGGNSALIAYDGYVDKIQRAVAVQAEGREEYFSSLEAFGERISHASHQSAQIELHTDMLKLGGNAPIMAESFGSLGIPVTCFGSMGFPEVHPVFQGMHSNVFKISAGQAADTNALEFDDGKLILSELGVFNSLDWQEIERRIDIEVLKFRLRRSNLIALVGWCNLPHATDIWNGILKTLDELKESLPMTFFFDLADPSKKSGDDILAVIETMAGCSNRGETILGLNENEANVLNRALGGDPSKNLAEKGKYLYSKIPVHKIIIHPIERSLVVQKSGATEVPGRVVARPKVSTGGGDNFNAGYCLGRFIGAEEEECLLIAMATSGSYVETGKSPSLESLKEYLARWSMEL